MAIIKRLKISKLKKVAAVPISMLKGLDGTRGLTGAAGRTGLDGKDGIEGKKGGQGQPGPTGPKGLAGKEGLPGRDGESLNIEDILSKLKKKNDKEPYPGGMIGAIKYTAVTVTAFKVPSHNLIPGINIFGVNTSAPTTIYLPKKIQKGVLITIKDESSSAATNNITIEKQT